METRELGDFRWDDGRISKLVLENASALLLIRDWQGNSLETEFNDVIGIEGFGVVNVDLGSVNESQDDPLIERACLAAAEPSAEFNCYTFCSAWIEQPLIKIVARSCVVRKA